jgi:hypothetical protein
MNLLDLTRIRDGRRTGRCSSYDTRGRNADYWIIPPGESRVLADIRGPGIITHLWMTQANNYRECLLRFTWDDALAPSVLCPLGDFFGLGHSIVNSYQSLLFSASTGHNHGVNKGCALNAYVAMPFRRRALLELVNESAEHHMQYFYVDYETCRAADLQGAGYLHAEFRRTNPFSGWAPEIRVNTPLANVVNREQVAWRNNYVILETAVDLAASKPLPGLTGAPHARDGRQQAPGRRRDEAGRGGAPVRRREPATLGLRHRVARLRAAAAARAGPRRVPAGGPMPQVAAPRTRRSAHPMALQRTRPVWSA